MRTLDQTDLDILRLLSEDARRPYSDIADHVGLSAPAVSDRIERLQEQGVIEGFTIEMDRSKLQYSVPVVVTLAPAPGAVEAVYETLGALDRVEHRFKLADGRLIAHIDAPQTDVHGWLADHIDLDQQRSYEITHLVAHDWATTLTATDFAVPCAVCDNRVKDDGVTARIGGEVKAFCCPSCKARYEEQYQALADDA